MLLPHSGALAAFGTCCFTYSSTAASASATLTGDCSISGSRPDFVCISRTKSFMRDERFGVGVHDELDAVVERRERRVGDDAGDLDDHIGLDDQTGHLEVDPYQAVVGDRNRRRPRRHLMGRSDPARGARYRLAVHG